MRFVATLKSKPAALLFLFMACLATSSLQADLITNPAMAIEYQTTINPIIVSNTDGTNESAFFGNAVQEANIKMLIDEVWAQAGIDIEWQAPEFWSNDFANIGTVGNNNPRPTGDLDAVRDLAAAAGFNDSDPNVINIYFVEIAAGFPDVSENTANGLAFVGGNGITQHVGDNLLGFLGGREVVASVVAHEIGHNLGLPHLAEAENLMQEGGSPNQGERLNAAQIVTARASSFSVAVAVPEPSSLVLVFGVAAVVAVQRRRSA